MAASAGRLQVLSDLHLEFCQHRAQVEAVLSRAIRSGGSALGTATRSSGRTSGLWG